MVRRSGQRERLRRVSERRQGTERTESGGNAARTAIVAAVLTGVSAVIVSLITGLGSSLQGFVADALSGEEKPAASSAPPRPGSATPVKVVVIPGESSSWLVAKKRATSAEDKATLTRGGPLESWNRLYRNIGAVSLTRTAYTVTVTNPSSSPVRVVGIVPVITQRTKAIDTTKIMPLGGLESDSTQVELNLDNRYPEFTQDGKPYFSRKSQVLGAGEGFVMVVESKLLRKEYVEYHLRADYIDSKGSKHSLQVNDPDPIKGSFRVSGTLDNKDYTDYWGANKDRTAHRLYSVEERK
ncbi:hypothetical protein [Streptomyces sp. JV184]|uniref:hypothetical protein n=1 Tax=Streptomyces sp. JV184 TaxID=858637 RepID=UPI002E7917C5|nr:hypothetical protein [Streptomyces sp. JV184]MEE1749507.1 hypothetical protein [Streptomyces sp. JV184]